MDASEARAAAADALLLAHRSGVPMRPPSEMWPLLTIDDAYAIQTLNIERRKEGFLTGGAPARVVGYKIGITSKAVQSWLKVSEPDFGHLLDAMWVPPAGDVKAESLLQPRIEGEIAFVLGEPLKGPGLTFADVVRATDHVVASLEIIDSRIADWKITYTDTIADNASSGMFVLGGTPRSIRGLDLELCGMALRKNGRVVSTGAGAACLGHPVAAAVWLANTLGTLGVTLEPGSVILSGALGPVTEVKAGDVVDLDVSGLGAVRVSFS